MQIYVTFAKHYDTIASDRGFVVGCFHYCQSRFKAYSKAAVFYNSQAAVNSPLCRK